MKTVTRSDAKVRGRKRYFTGRACRRQHVAERYVACGHCVKCASRARAST